MSKKFVNVQCCNPLDLCNHAVRTNLIDFPWTLKEKFPQVAKGAKICLKCKPKVYQKSKQLAADAVVAEEIQKAAIVVLEQIKEKFSQSSNKEERLLLLTLSPKYWSRNQIINYFNCTEYEARIAKDLIAENGILTRPHNKNGRQLSDEIKTLVNNFYVRDDVSRIMPGFKDVISVKQNNGKRMHFQKRLLLGDLKDLYQQFIKENETTKISISVFTKLRPTYCILAGANGTHNVCVCTQHENVNLMLSKIPKNIESPYNDYQACINSIVCQSPSENCHLGQCLDCPNTNNLKEALLTSFNENDFHEITFDSWMQTDRCTIVSQTMNTHEFLDLLGEKLMKLKTHDYVARQQSQFVSILKKNLKDGEFMVQMDFAENYAFIVQNSTQAFHWNNNQATIFTVVIYYREREVEKHKSIAIISDNLNHDTVAVYEYQKIITQFLKDNFVPKKIYYFSDGASQHFKNKSNFENLRHHEEDFGMPAEWHFFASSHGKGGCDGVGAILKRGARRASLQVNAENRIDTPKTLFTWSAKYCKETAVFFSSKENYEKTAVDLQSRFKHCKTIKGTLQYHAIIPQTDGSFILKFTSMSSMSSIFPEKKMKKKRAVKTATKRKRK